MQAHLENNWQNLWSENREQRQHWLCSATVVRFYTSKLQNSKQELTTHSWNRSGTSAVFQDWWMMRGIVLAAGCDGAGTGTHLSSLCLRRSTHTWLY